MRNNAFHSFLVFLGPISWVVMRHVSTRTRAQAGSKSLAQIDHVLQSQQAAAAGSSAFGRAAVSIELVYDPSPAADGGWQFYGQ